LSSATRRKSTTRSTVSSDCWGSERVPKLLADLQTAPCGPPFGPLTWQRTTARRPSGTETNGINVDTGRLSATSVYFNNLAIGRYLTTKDARLVKELVVHTSVSTLSDVAGRAGHISDSYLMPGFRFGLGEGQKWYVMGGVQVPVSGPQSYVWQPNFALVKNYWV
jgi:hypothetical protein